MCLSILNLKWNTDQYTSFLLIAFLQCLTHSPHHTNHLFLLFDLKVHAYLFITTLLSWAEGWHNKPVLIIKLTTFPFLKNKVLNQKMSGYLWTKWTILHAPQVSTWEVLLNSLAPKLGQYCPIWWLSISMATHHWGMYSGRVNMSAIIRSVKFLRYYHKSGTKNCIALF